jgi:formylglycine-generating enzyme required for sulfatase activity
MALLIVAAACAPAATPVPTDTPTPAAAEPPTDTPTLVTVPTEPGPTATLTPVPLTGPPMEVGSKYVIFDLSTVIAVPNQGPYLMGHGGTDNPVHEVTVSDFWIYQAKVTNRQYALCEAAGKCLPPNPCTEPTCAGGNRAYTDPKRSNDPVVAVDWARAEAYCTWVGGRLPTEAEWEKAAAWDEAKKEHRIYPWGDKAPNCDLENFGLCKGTTTDVTTHPLGISYYEGLDFSGNAYEWVADWYLSTYYGQSPVEDPQGPELGTKRSIRSTAYNAPGYSTEAAARYRDDPKAHRNDLGFRCVVEDPTQYAPMCEQTALYGSGPGGGGPGPVPSPSCPTVSINQFQLECNNMASTTNVIFNSSDPAAIVDPGTCGTHYDLAPFPEGYNCNAPTNVSIKAFCVYSDPGPATCATHYNLNPGTGICEWDGTGAINPECPDGYEFDEENQCCTVDPGGSANYPLCPPGYSPVEGPPGTFKCLPGSDPGFVQQVVGVNIKACEGPGDGGDGCNLTCQYGMPQGQCCCLAYPGAQYCK